jgi:hypothetical protein
MESETPAPAGVSVVGDEPALQPVAASRREIAMVVRNEGKAPVKVRGIG